MWSAGYTCGIVMKVEFSRQIFEKLSNNKFHENPSSGSRVVPWWQKDRHNWVHILKWREILQIYLEYRENFCPEIGNTRIISACANLTSRVIERINTSSSSLGFQLRPLLLSTPTHISYYYLYCRFHCFCLFPLSICWHVWVTESCKLWVRLGSRDWSWTHTTHSHYCQETFCSIWYSR